MSTFRLGVDIGGTFTDIVLLGADGTMHTKKILSTPHDYSEAIENGIAMLIAETRIDPGEIHEVVHGTTVATNAIIERTGVRVALLTTAGFRDILEIARFRSPRLYDVTFRKPPPLVERRLRFEVPERIAADGSTVLPVDAAAVVQVAQRCAELKVDAIAICLINAYVTGRHEEAVATLLREHLPGIPVTISSELVPQIQEYERSSTAVINAYIRPVVERYTSALESRLRRLGIDVPLNIMQSNGGVLSASTAAQKPIFIIESGPAAGVVGAQRIGALNGLGDVLAFDMGGTTAKAAIIVDGEFGMTPETEVGGGEALGHRMVRGGGYVVQAPTIDIAEVGAGGGSIAWVDAGGALQVGPRSAGADPGPVCYGTGGTNATVTDANLVLGYLNPENLVGGDLSLDRGGAESAIAALADELKQTSTDIAYGIHQIANARMMRALSAVSSERGLDPARFAMFAFGGNGGVHACGLAESLGIERVVVPPAAGLFSALGLIFADAAHQCIRAFYHGVDGLDLDAINTEFSTLQAEAEGLLRADGYDSSAQALSFAVEMKYLGQNAALLVPVTSLPIDHGMVEGMAEEFAQRHLATFGYRSDGEALQLVSLNVVARGVSETARVPDRISLVRESGRAAASRRVYFGAERGWLETPVLRRSSLTETAVDGPAIIEEYDNTIVARPGWSFQIDHWGNLILEAAH
jgi:N-methylhydantoinase A